MQQNNLYISNINDLTEITKYMHNVFISHYGEDEPHLDSLKARLKTQYQMPPSQRKSGLISIGRKPLL